MPENESTPTTTHELDKPATGDQGAVEADRFFKFIRERTQELKSAGMPEGRARSTAMLEHRISQWPPEWGNELRIIVFGDFRSPETDLVRL